MVALQKAAIGGDGGSCAESGLAVFVARVQG